MKLTKEKAEQLVREQGETITIPDDVDVVDIETFEGCKVVRQVIFTKCVKEIKPGAFGDCENLERVDIYNPDVTLSLSAFTNHNKIYVYGD